MTDSIKPAYPDGRTRTYTDRVLVLTDDDLVVPARNLDISEIGNHHVSRTYVDVIKANLVVLNIQRDGQFQTKILKNRWGSQGVVVTQPPEKSLIVIATKDHDAGLYYRGLKYEVIDEDPKRNQIQIRDERDITCWYSWRHFVEV